jgi:transposase
LEQIKATIKEQNDITLEKIIEKLNLPIKRSILSVIAVKFGFSFKKRHYSLKNS